MMLSKNDVKMLTGEVLPLGRCGTTVQSIGYSAGYVMIRRDASLDAPGGQSMPWWGWMIVGAALLGAEMFVIDAQFYLVFFGIAAAVVGLAGLAGMALPDWVQWLAFAVLSIVSMLAFRQRFYEKLRRPGGQLDERLTLGDRIRLPARLSPGDTCRVDYRGSSWSASNIGDTAIESGGDAEIVAVDRLTLRVRRPG
jgi:membrane protein implicated in regulation of membrane protease activity